MAIQKLFEPFVLSPMDHANPELFVLLYLSFHIQDQEKALHDISQGVHDLILRIPFLSGEVAPSTRLSAVKNVCEVRPSTTTPDSVISPMLKVKYHANRLGKSSTAPDVSHDPLPSSLPETQPRPIIRFQANVFSDGIILTVAYNHMVIDGTGGGIILEFLAESCRSQSPAELDKPSPNEHTPIEEGYFRELMLNMKPLSGESNNDDFFKRLFGTPSSSQFQRDLIEGASTASRKLSEEYMIFSAKKIDQMTQACNYVLACLREGDEASQLPEVDVPLPPFVSINNVLTALLWGLIIKARHAPGESSKQDEQQKHEHDCTMAVNLRPFFDPPFPKSYMGNTVTPVRLTVKSADFLKTATNLPKDLYAQVASLFGVDLYSLLPIAYTAYRIRHQLSRIDDKYVRGLTTFLKGHKDWNTMKFGPADIMITSWRHLKVYGLDFGHSLGYIEKFSNQRSPVGNVCLIMPASVPNTGAADTKKRTRCSPWVVRVTLDENTMDAFRKDGLLQWAIEN